MWDLENPSLGIVPLVPFWIAWFCLTGKHSPLYLFLPILVELSFVQRKGLTNSGTSENTGEDLEKDFFWSKGRDFVFDKIGIPTEDEHLQ
jgi:hypothetical protein